ncbi:MAG: hypothetical protein Terrestrivirus3_17 [Terrestrivirus sp.]|uniref:Uncharacterized protein n=1 Tax=Terrestrivirus sp. TaxID=2487775 RepID=A0A3G4ZLP5_9VIRU|nr:MAG: hypothetical protein Terrestrivirus3_17 [Terrestrivirus sp.]
MYINKIDDLLDKIIDDFYTNIVIKDKNKRLSKLLEEQNFVKYQKDINDILIDYVKTINVNEIRELVKNEDNVKTILNIIKRYITFYLFLTLGVFYTGKNDTYINNVVEFTKNQVAYPFRVDNFFNSENNALLIKYNELVKNIISLVDMDSAKLSAVSGKLEYKDAISLLNNLGSDYIDSAYRLENLNGNVNDQVHNIIKTIIILLIYKKTEKEDVFRILETVENEGGEYTFIDIVIPRTQHIDFSSVEALFTKKEMVRGLAHEFWGYLTEQNSLKIIDINVDDKILHLINSRILVPVVDDFLLYHKDSEKYDKQISDPTKAKKKEDTKIRYIVNKIDRASELYSDSANKDPKIKQDIKKLFHTPLADRRAVLYNNNEEIKIINKLLNQGKRSIENNEYYNDLIHYRKYPYINFKDFRDYGFSIQMNNTIPVIRAVSLDGEQKQNERNIIQLRTGAKDNSLNIIGFVIPTNLRPLDCLKIRDILDVRTLSKKTNNGYEIVNKFLQQSEINGKRHQSSVFWHFNTETDSAEMDTYEQLGKQNLQEQIRFIVSKLYDDILNELYYEITEKISSFKEISLYNAFKIIESREKQTIEIPRDSKLYEQIEDLIYYTKAEKAEPRYDENDDIFYGLSGSVIKLQKIQEKKPPLIQTVKVNPVRNYKNELFTEDNTESLENESTGAVCQHNITWEKISVLRKKDPNKYGDLLFDFIEQYVIENIDQEYICKSCSHQLNIKKFILDGTFDDETQRFITFSMPLDVPLEEIPEYAKYNIAIRNIDKTIEKIASICSIPYFIGTSYSVKFRRKAITKDAIDIIMMNNQKLKKNFRERNQQATKTYGVSRDLSNLFVFDLDNSIFVYSSKEKDYYKAIKYNNVLAYVIILMMLEMNNSHIGFMYGDIKGFCNYPIFEKFGHTLFDNLKIRKNNSGETIDVKRYKTFCYILYIMSCFITKYNMWHYESATVTEVEKTKGKQKEVIEEKPAVVDLKKIYKPITSKTKKKFDPKIQKVIIHTVIDVLNSVLEISSTEANNQRLYDVISAKYFKKMNDTFIDSSLLDTFKISEKSSVSTERKGYVLADVVPIKLLGPSANKKVEYDSPNYATCKTAKYFVTSRQQIKEKNKIYRANNVTNCPSGEFHEWEMQGKLLVCKICGTSINVEYNKELTEEIVKNIKYVALTKLAKKYCFDGTLHNYLYTNNDDKKLEEKSEKKSEKKSDEKCVVCEKCKYSENYNYTHEELDKLEQSINKQKESERQKEQLYDNREKEIIKQEDQYDKSVMDKLIEHFKKNSTGDEPYKFIDQFIDNIQSIIGEDTGKDNYNVLLRDNVYIIDHDHNGYMLDKPIVISDKDNRIFYKSNHPFFKTDVIYYSSHRAGKLDVFYDATTHILLGYKEASKDFVLDKKTNRKIKINYSVANRLKLLGYSTHFINIKDKFERTKKENQEIGTYNKINDDREEIMKDILAEIIRERIHNLKKVIIEVQRFIYKIKNSTQLKKESSEDDKYGYNPNREEEADPFVQLLDKYNKKITNMQIEDDKGSHRIFKHWKVIYNNIFAEKMDDKAVNIGDIRLLNVEEISKYDTNGNMLLYYIVSEIDKLLHFNQNKVLRTNIVMFLIDFTSLVFNMFNMDEIFNTYDIKRFMYILDSAGYVYDVEQKGHGLETETAGIYEEYKDEEAPSDEQIEKELDDEEEADALDIDVDAEGDEEVGDYYPRMYDDWSSDSYLYFNTY